MQRFVLTILIGAAAIATSCGGGEPAARANTASQGRTPAEALAAARESHRPTACSLVTSG